MKKRQPQLRLALKDKTKDRTGHGNLLHLTLLHHWLQKKLQDHCLLCKLMKWLTYRAAGTARDLTSRSFKLPDSYVVFL
jgi:hypothetical protein